MFKEFIILIIGLFLFVYSWHKYLTRPDFFLQLGNLGFWVFILSLMLFIAH